jgi:hypothetical protein
MTSTGWAALSEMLAAAGCDAVSARHNWNRAGASRSEWTCDEGPARLKAGPNAPRPARLRALPVKL